MINSFLNTEIEENHFMMFPGTEDGFSDIYRSNRKPYLEERCS